MGLLYRKAGRAERVRKIEKDLPITNRLGLHARPAAMFVQDCESFSLGNLGVEGRRRGKWQKHHGSDDASRWPRIEAARPL